MIFNTSPYFNLTTGAKYGAIALAQISGLRSSKIERN